MKTRAYGLLPILLFAGMGCSGNSSNNDGGPMTTSGPWVPLKVGNRWTYTVTDIDGSVSAKVQGVTAQTVVGGTGPSAAKMAYKLVTGDKFDDKNGDVSYQDWVDSRLVRYREISIGGSSGATKKEEHYDPARLRIDDTEEHRSKGASWPESYLTVEIDTPSADADAGAPDGGAGVITTMDQTVDIWNVVGVDETVTVPMGTFKALVVQRIGNSGASDKTFWFVRGIGKVKETGVGDQTEVLSDYEIK
jgi:hypothetical protein